MAGTRSIPEDTNRCALVSEWQIAFIWSTCRGELHSDESSGCQDVHVLLVVQNVLVRRYIGTSHGSGALLCAPFVLSFVPVSYKCVAMDLSIGGQWQIVTSGNGFCRGIAIYAIPRS